MSGLQPKEHAMNALSRRFPHLLAAAYVPFWAYLAVSPVSREVWWAENIPVMAVFALLALTFRMFRFSNAAYALMAVWLFWHTVGGHYNFAGVPFGWVTDLFGFEPFSIGFYAFPVAGLLLRKRLCGPVVATLFALFAIMALAAGYEIIEWWYAVLEGGEAGIEFLGSQGDVWDAQKDMLLDTLGAATSLAAYHLLRPDRRPAREPKRQGAQPEIHST